MRLWARKEKIVSQVANDYLAQLREVGAGELEGLEVLADMHEGNLEASKLDQKTWQLVRIAALATLDAGPMSWRMNLGLADEMGMTAEEVIGTLIAIAPVVGTARIVSAAGNIAKAMNL
jgi:alkylhydroperoxidase/carboxymuconolactone decarboxylase family protein YurZ